MSSNKFDAKFSPIRYDPAGAFIPETGLSRDDQVALRPRLEAARRAVLGEKRPPNSAFLDLPERLLAEYGQSRAKSMLGRVLATARRLRDSVDRVMFLGLGSAGAGIRTLFGACCHPYHNELGRGDRGGRPRIYFVEDNLNNDAVQGLLDLVNHGRMARTVDERWAIVVADNDSDSIDVAAGLGNLLGPLGDSCGGDAQTLADLIVPIARATDPLFRLAQELGCPEIFDSLETGGSDAILSPIGLLPAAVMGLDVVRLLEGAVAMTERFRSAPAGDNPVLDFAAVGHLLATVRGVTVQELVPWMNELEPVNLWHDVLSDGFGRFAADLRTKMVCAPSRPIEHPFQPGYKRFLTYISADSVRRDRLATDANPLDDAWFKALAGKTLPDMQAAWIRNSKEAYAAAGHPTVEIRLPALDEGALGQLFQMLMLAAVVEGQLWPVTTDQVM